VSAAIARQRSCHGEYDEYPATADLERRGSLPEKPAADQMYHVRPATHLWVEGRAGLARLGRRSGYLADGGVGQVLRRKVIWMAGIPGIRRGFARLSG